MRDPKRLTPDERADAESHAMVQSSIWPGLLLQEIAALEAELAEARAMSARRLEALRMVAIEVRDIPDDRFDTNHVIICRCCGQRARIEKHRLMPDGQHCPAALEVNNER